MKFSKILASVFALALSSQGFAETILELQGAPMDDSQDYTITLDCAAELTLAGTGYGNAIELTAGNFTDSPREAGTTFTNNDVTIAANSDCNSTLTWTQSAYENGDDEFLTTVSTVTIATETDASIDITAATPLSSTIKVDATGGDNQTTNSNVYTSTVAVTLTAVAP